KGVGPRAAVERGDLTAGRSLRQIAGRARATGAVRLEGLLMGGSLSCGRSVGPRIISGAAPAVAGIRAARIGLAPYPRIAALVAALLFWSCAAVAQPPGYAITIIVPYTPGTGPDILARLLGEEIQVRWRQPVVIENKPGASGNIGTQVAARAPADGST